MVLIKSADQAIPVLIRLALRAAIQDNQDDTLVDLIGHYCQGQF